MQAGLFTDVPVNLRARPPVGTKLAIERLSKNRFVL
jgi:hypothetical protein